MSNVNYDLIIVGAGTAGCVLAERLTRPGRLRVLLIEAGAVCDGRTPHLHAAREDARWRDGPMLVSPNRNARPVSRAFSGAWLCEIAHRDGKRYSVYDAYLKPAMRRENLQVVTDAQATRVAIAGGRVAGVVVSRAGQESNHASRHVVLAAGAFGSPFNTMRQR